MEDYVSKKKLESLIEARDVDALREYMKVHNLVVKEGKIVPKSPDEYSERNNFWDKRQYVRKILLNSLYGALLNPYCRFYDPRIGQSVTLTGRCITKFMMEKINELVTGVSDRNGDAIIYGDTDSAYFSAEPMFKDMPEFEPTKDNVIALYDTIGAEVNTAFSGFMQKAFFTNEKRGSIIQAGREIVASKGIFLKKKRYAALVFDEEGKRFDSDMFAGKKGILAGLGKIKAMGVETKRSDTSKEIQVFLENVLELVLRGESEPEVIDFIYKFREEFKQWSGWHKGTPKGIKGLTKYSDLIAKANGSKVNMPGHVRAALNWNKLRDLHRDYYSDKITDGSKIVVCKLRHNAYGITSIAYPVDQARLPDWFKELPFDDDAMEDSVVEKKLENLIGVLKWDLERSKPSTQNSLLFQF